MIWLTWRQFRVQTLSTAALLAAAATYFLITGVHLHHTYTADLVACTPLGSCDSTLNDFQHSYDMAFHLNELLVVAAPALMGMFWGAPLIGRELETGTDQLAWNQSVTRTRWLSFKLAGIGLCSIAVAGILSYLLTWWAGPLDHLNGNRFAAMTFASRDIVPIGYAAFTFALGTTAGLLLRRTIPAMAVTLAVFVGIQILMPTTIRPHLLASTTHTFAINQATTSQANGIYGNNGGAELFISGLNVPPGAWVISAPPVEDSSDHVVAMSEHLNCFPPPPNGTRPEPGTTKGPGNFAQIGTCLAPLHLHESVTYQPATHYWPLQWFETAIFLALAGALSASCFWWIRRR
ncbi:MAG: hypothetical protein JWR52_1641 [Marmoricola sp.]|nr:hypothetical protein [Marmoricola sp.]